MQNWKGLDIDKKRGGAEIIEALGSKEMEDGSQNILGYLENIPGNLDRWILGTYSRIFGYLENIPGWRQNNLGLDVWMDMEISVTASDAGKVPTLSFTSEDLIARLHSISFHVIF